jgi:hypothetical protein
MVGSKGAPIIDSVCVERTMRTRIHNNGQSNLLREKTLVYEKELDQSRRTSLREEQELRRTMTELGKIPKNGEEWLCKNHDRYNQWKMRERTKLRSMHSSRSVKDAD